MGAWSIPLGIQQPQFMNPMQARQQALTLQQLGGQVAINRQLQQENALKLQAMQEDQQDQQTIEKTYADAVSANPGKPIDYNKDIRPVVAPQIRLRNLQAMDQMNQKQAQAAQEMATSKSVAQKADFENLKNHYDLAGNAIEGIFSSPDDDTKNALYRTAVNQLNQAGFDTSVLPSSVPDEKTLTAYAAAVGHRRAILDNAKAAADTQETQAKAAAAERAQATQDLQLVADDQSFQQWKDAHPQVAKSSNAPATFDPDWAAKFARSTVPAVEQPKYDLQQLQAKALKAFQSQDGSQIDRLVDQIVPEKDPMNASTKSLLKSAAARGASMDQINQIIKDAYDQRGRVQVAREGIQNRIALDLGSFGGTASEPSPIARAVAEYRMPLTAAVGRGGPVARSALVNQVLAINPNFQEQYYNTFQKTETDAVTGKIGTSANALNTMMGHLSILNQAADALKNNDLQALNKIANWVGVQTGQTPVTTYNTIVHRLGPEVTKAYLASGGSVGERGTNEEDFDAKLGPDQIKQNIGVSALLADSKIKALQDQYNRGTYGKGQQKLISDEAQQARQNLTQQAPSALQPAPGTAGQKPAQVGVSVKAPNGKTYVFKTQADADNFKKAAGIQ